MKSFSALFLAFVILLVLAGSVRTLAAPAQASAPQNSKAASGPATSDQKRADIRKLLDLTGTKKLMTSSMDGMMTSIRPVLENSLPAGDYRPQLIDLFLAKFKEELDLDRFLDMAAEIYDKNFSHEEIKQLIAFYQTSAGQKLVSVLPAITEEMRAKGESWGKELGQQSMMEVLAEHPDLRAAMQAAAAKSQVK